MMSGHEYRRKIQRCDLWRVVVRRWRKIARLWQGPRQYLAASSVLLGVAWFIPLLFGIEADVALELPGVGVIDLTLKQIVACGVGAGAFGLWVSTEHQSPSFLAGALLTLAFWCLPAMALLDGPLLPVGVFLFAPASLSFWCVWRWFVINMNS